MSSAKSNEQAAKCRESGSEFLAERKFYESLVLFNQSLCFAEPGSTEIALAYEARSEVFYQIGQYEKCLRNIQAAREHGYPEDRLDKLIQREESCRKFMKEGRFDELKNFTELSHPPSQKLPFVIDCLELRKDEKFGRYIIATKDLQPGDVIAFEESHFTFFSLKSCFTKCFNCLRSNMLDLIPSSASVMFCSIKCCKESYKKFNNKDELIRDSLRGNDIRQKMLRIMSVSLSAARGFDELQNLASDKTIFDFDISDANDDELKKKLLTCVCSLMPKVDCGVASYLKSILNLPEGDRKDFFVNFISRIILIYMRNGVKLPGRGSNIADGGLLLPFVAIFNHSCDPNIYASFVDNKCLITVIKPIRADEQIFINYRKSFMEQAREERQAELLKTYEFKCECEACINNYPLPNKLERINNSFTLPSFGRYGNNEELLVELEESFSFIKTNIEHHPCFETAAVLMRIKELIRTIGDRIAFPCESCSLRL